MHKMHHRYVEIDTVLATFYVHPLDHVCINLIPILLGPILTRMDFVSVWIWIAVSTFSGINNHSQKKQGFLLPSPKFHTLHQ